MNVLVTGGAGFIGSHVVDILIRAGHRVSIVDNLWEHGGGRMENVNPQAKFYKIDIRSDTLSEVFDIERPKVVCHHAAQHSVKMSMDDPLYDADVNIRGLLNLLHCAVQYGTQKIIFASSGATYGTVDTMPIDEHTPQHPVSPYAISKMTSEYYLRFWKDAHGLDFTSLRYGNVFGPRQDPTGEAGVIAIFSHSILSGKPVRIDWDGEQQKDYVYVGDVAKANLLSLEKGSGEMYCIASGSGTSVNSIFRGLVEIIGHKVDTVTAPKRPGDVYLSYFDCCKAEQELGWRAETSFEDGLRLTVEYFASKHNINK